MKSFSIKQITTLSLVAAIYVILTINPLISSVAFGVIQFRISEILNHLVLYNKKYSIALFLGVLISNIFSGAGVIDMIVGSLATLASCLISIYAYRYIKSTKGKIIFNIFNFSFISMIPIAIMLDVLGFTDQTLLISYIFLVLSEMIIMIIGAFIIPFINKTIKFDKILN